MVFWIFFLFSLDLVALFFFCLLACNAIYVLLQKNMQCSFSPLWLISFPMEKENFFFVVHNEFKFPRVSGLEVTNMPGTAKALGSNLTGSFFSKRETFRFKKIVGVLFAHLCFVGLVATSYSSFAVCSSILQLCFCLNDFGLYFIGLLI